MTKSILSKKIPSKTKQIKWAIESFFYKSRVNIAVDHLLKTSQYSQFQEKVEEAIYKQILFFAKVEKIEQIFGSIDKPKEDKGQRKRLLELWIPLVAIIDDETRQDYLQWAGTQGGQTALDKVHEDYKFVLKDKKLINSLNQRAKDFPEMVDQTTQNWLIRKVSDLISQGKSSLEIARTIRDLAKEVSGKRADGIAEHEAMLAFGLIEEEFYKKNKVKTHKWITARDEVVCILQGSAKVFTLNDLKPIKDIKIGDYVLTHKDRYRKVINTYKRNYFGKVVRIKLSVSGSSENSIRLTLTKDHPVLVLDNNNRQVWKTAENLNNDDMVYIAGKKCGCGKIIPFSKKKCISCYITAINKKRWKREGEKERLITFNKKYNKGLLMIKAQKRDRSLNPQKYIDASRRAKLTKKERWNNDPSFRKKYFDNNRKTAKYSTHPFRLISNDKKRQEKVLKLAHIALGKNHLGKSYLEKKVEWFLKKERINYVSQWFYRFNEKRAWADFYLPQNNCVIECDGYFHNNIEIKNLDKEKDGFLKNNGIKIFRFNDYQIRNRFNEVASVIKQLNCIMPVKIKKVEKYFLKPRSKYSKYQVVYNLQVEDDNSYIVNGIVVHNCNICMANEEAGETPVGEIFPSGVEYPPQHQRCRCITMPIITNDFILIWMGSPIKMS